MARLADQIEIAHPQHPHCATVLVLDVSGSMKEHGKIEQLNEGLTFFREDVASDQLARKRVDLAVLTFSDKVTLAHDFSPVDKLETPSLRANGSTAMGKAVLEAVALVERRKRQYKEGGVDYYRPWIFLLSDGEPTDMKPGDALWTRVKAAIDDGERERKFLFFAVGVEPANMKLLRELAPAEREPVQLVRGRFKEMFLWISRSQQRVSASRPGEDIALESPVGPKGWGKLSSG